MDGNTEERGRTVSVFNGPTPTIRILDSQADEANSVTLGSLTATTKRRDAHEVGVFVRSVAELARLGQLARKTVSRSSYSTRTCETSAVCFDQHDALAKGLGIPCGCRDGLR